MSSMLNFFQLNYLYLAMKPDRPKPKIIVRLPNWVGDVMMAIPSINALIHNDVEPILVGKPWAKDLLSGFNRPFHILSGQILKDQQILSKIKTSKKMILLTNSLSSALSARLAGKSTIGYRTDARGLILNHSLKKQMGLHEVAYFLNITEFAYSCWFPQHSWKPYSTNTLNIPITDQALQQATARLHQYHLEGEYWVICPFAHGKGQNGQSKVWPHWHELINQLNQHQIVICPGPGESADAFQKYAHVTIIKDTSLLEYAAIIKMGKQVIANDSGPMHLAASTNTPTLGIFGVSDPARVRPYGAEYVGAHHAWPSVSEVINRCSATHHKS